MKKIFAMFVISIISAFTLCSCASTFDKNCNAVAEITTTSGQSTLCLSFDASGNINYTGKQLAIKNARVLYVDESEEVKVHFYCDKCGHDETVTLIGTGSKMFECDCPLDGSNSSENKSDLRDYFAIITSTIDPTD